jgi:CheY-like chemotaxis protein
MIDDNEIDNLIHGRVLDAVNFASKRIVKNSAIDALEYLKKNLENAEAFPDLILLDINMPEMNGFGFLDEFEQLPAHAIANTSVVLLTSSLSLSDLERSHKYKSVKKYVNKPLRADELAI